MPNGNQTNFWDVLVWIGLGYIVIWLILKVTGAINTPIWLNWSPAFPVVYIIGRYMQKLSHIETTIKDMVDSVKVLNNDFRKIEIEHNYRTRFEKKECVKA